MLLMVSILLGGAFAEGLYQRRIHERTTFMWMLEPSFNQEYDSWWAEHSYV